MFQKFFRLNERNTIEEINVNSDKIVEIKNTGRKCPIEGVHPLAEVFVVTLDSGSSFEAVGIVEAVLSEINLSNKRILKG